MVSHRDDAAQDAAVWKRKYFDSLEELEAREGQWRRLEGLLRNTAIRLSLAAEGRGPDLDQQLDRLRRQLRRGRDDDVAELVGAVDEQVQRLESAGARPSGPAPGDPLVALIDRLDLPRPLARRARGLRKRIDRADSLEAVSALAEELARLLAAALEQAPAPKAGWRGLLGGRAQARAGEDESATSLGAARQVLEALLERLTLDPEHTRELEPLRARLPQADTTAELERLARHLGLALSDDARPADSPQARSVGPSVNEVLLQLLERLELPSDVSEQVEALQQRLEQPVAEGEWSDLLKTIAGLIVRMRARVQDEKRELEEFLAKLTARLEELDAHLQNVESERRDALNSGRSLDRAVQEQVRGIHSSVHEAADLDQLKLSIERRLQAIGSHMEDFRRHEDERSAAAEERIQQLNERLRSMERETAELRARVREERRLALIDALTGIYNRMAYDERIEQEYARWRRFGEPLSLVMADIDNFKDINDTYGHVAGDKVLRTIAKLLESKIRETDFLARYGGEEFVILMPGAGAADARAVAEKLRLEVESCGFHYRGTGVSITISCGIAEFGDGDDPDRVFERADNAMYRAKESGRNCSESAEA